MILAELSAYDPPVMIGAVLASLTFLCMLANSVMDLIAKAKGKTPQPPNEQLEQSHNSLENRVEKLEQWRTELAQKLESDKNQILRSGSERGRMIYNRIEETRKELDTKNAHLEAKIEAMPERIVTMLRNIKELGGK